MEAEVSMKQQRPHAFVGSLLHLAQEQDREALAHLRGMVRGSTADMLRAARYVAPYLGDVSFPSDQWYYVVGGLFAYHPMHVPNGPTLGGALARVRGDRGGMDGRVLALLGTDESSLQKPLFQAVSLLSAGNQGLDYFRLLDDLCAWGHPDSYVQKRWARDYFRHGITSGQAPESEEAK